MDSSRTIKQEWRIFFFLVLLYCLFRIPILLSRYDPLMGLHDPGAIAVELLEGNSLPFWAYAIQPYAGGALFTGLYTVPFFALFGKSLLVSKLVPFCLHLVALLAWFLILKSYFNIRQIFWILLFVIIPPPKITQYMLINYGLHFEVISWMACSLMLFKKFLEGKLSEIKASVLLGLLGGLTTWVVPTNILTGVVIWIYLAWVKVPSIRKKIFFGVYPVAFLAGFSPLIYTNWNIHWQVLDFFGEMASFPLSLSYFFGKAQFVIHDSLAGLFQFWTLPKFANSFVTKIFTFSYLFSLIFLVVDRKWVVRRWGYPLNLILFGLGYQILLLGAAVMSASVVKDFYLFPLLPFVAIHFVVIGMRLVELGLWGQRVRVGFAAFFLLPLMLANLRLVDYRQIGWTRKIQGYSYSQWLGHLPILQDTRNFSGYVRMFNRFRIGHPPKIQRIFYQAIPKDFFAINSETSLQNSLDFIIKADPEFQSILFEKLGFQLGVYCQLDPKRLEDFLKLRDWDESVLESLHRGAVQSLGILENEHEKTRRSLAWCEFVPEISRGGCYEGLAQMGIHPDVLRDHPLSPNFLPSFFKGHGYHLAGVFRQDPLTLAFYLQTLNRSKREWALSGIKERVSWEEDEYLQKIFFKDIGLQIE